MRALRISAVVEKAGISRALVYRLQAAGRFPRAIKLSAKRVGWLEEEVDAWIAERRSVPPADRRQRHLPERRANVDVQGRSDVRGEEWTPAGFASRKVAVEGDVHSRRGTVTARVASVDEFLHRVPRPFAGREDAHGRKGSERHAERLPVKPADDCPRLPAVVRDAERESGDERVPEVVALAGRRRPRGAAADVRQKDATHRLTAGEQSAVAGRHHGGTCVDEQAPQNQAIFGKPDEERRAW
jgi:prophage regulatory protein